MQTTEVDRTRGTVPVRRHVGMYAPGEYPRGCPGCGSEDSRVTHTRETILGGKTVRDRTCGECGRRYVTLAPR